MFVHTVVVAGDRTSANVYTFADIRITDVSQMVYLAAIGNRAFLYFDKVADFYVVRKLRARP